MRTLIALTLTLALTGCVGITKTIEITGESIVGLAPQFDAVSRHMTAGCITQTYTVATCDAFRSFSDKFKQAYPAAKSLWNTASAFDDKGLSTSATSALTKLSSDLAPYLVLMTAGKGK